MEAGREKDEYVCLVGADKVGALSVVVFEACDVPGVAAGGAGPAQEGHVNIARSAGRALRQGRAKAGNPTGDGHMDGTGGRSALEGRAGDGN